MYYKLELIDFELVVNDASLKYFHYRIFGLPPTMPLYKYTDFVSYYLLFN